MCYDIMKLYLFTKKLAWKGNRTVLKERKKECANTTSKVLERSNGARACSQTLKSNQIFTRSLLTKQQQVTKQAIKKLEWR